ALAGGAWPSSPTPRVRSKAPVRAAEAGTRAAEAKAEARAAEARAAEARAAEARAAEAEALRYCAEVGEAEPDSSTLLEPTPSWALTDGSTQTLPPPVGMPWPSEPSWPSAASW